MVAPALRIVDEHTLDYIQIAKPCDVSWDAMTGDDQVRHCKRCKQNVYDISTLTRVEAVALINLHEGRACLRLYRRPDGTLMTQDCSTRLRKARQRGLAAFGAMLAISTLPFVASLCSDGSLGIPPGVIVDAPTAGVPVMGEPPPILMGKVAPHVTVDDGAPDARRDEVHPADPDLGRR